MDLQEKDTSVFIDDFKFSDSAWTMWSMVYVAVTLLSFR